MVPGVEMAIENVVCVLPLVKKLAAAPGCGRTPPVVASGKR